MPEHSSLHAYLNWTKERIDEMDATLAGLEARAHQAQAASRPKMNQMIADLKKRRDEFEATARQASDATWQRIKGQLDSQWQGFEGQLKVYFDTAGKHFEQQQAIFRDVAAAQVKAWREAAEMFHSEVVKLTAGRRADLEHAVKQMKAQAADAEARLEKLRQVGDESWTALSAALAEARNAFDRSNRHAGDVLDRAGPPKASTGPSRHQR